MPDCVLSQTDRRLLDLTWDWPPEGDDAVPRLSAALQRGLSIMGLLTRSFHQAGPWSCSSAGGPVPGCWSENRHVAL